MPDLYEHIGKRIRELRLSRAKGSLSQEALAKEIGVPANTLSRWETATYKPSALELDKLARFFQVSVTEFFPGMSEDVSRIKALTSATGGLDEADFDEIIKYAEFRKAHRALEGAKRSRAKRKDR